MICFIRASSSRDRRAMGMTQSGASLVEPMQCGDVQGNAAYHTDHGAWVSAPIKERCLRPAFCESVEIPLLSGRCDASGRRKRAHGESRDDRGMIASFIAGWIASFIAGCVAGLIPENGYDARVACPLRYLPLCSMWCCIRRIVIALVIALVIAPTET